MAAKFFGQFLLEQGLINRQQLLAALEAQHASNPLEPGCRRLIARGSQLGVVAARRVGRVPPRPVTAAAARWRTRSARESSRR